ncbi:lysosomal acid glucosylceramidase-like [Coccinella septempunctata]|uniref:lysosomal acid glucosylceramidase-like n=1 Tax=Coccinella septempunctata TaxID=41139 RepID=UPI001D08E2EE|nr:lysosomal acid glucosylceramidase-like [Coccinella septempunctata]
MFPLLICEIFLFVYASAASDCLLREYGENKKVCVCNSEHCDYFSENLALDKVNIITSTQSGARYRTSVQDFETVSNSTNLITINRNKTYQKINGFGGALTDTAGVNIMSLPAGAAEHLMRSYFTGTGSMYNLCRVPMGGTDFSTRGYSYDDGPEDKNLSNFKLAEEDFKYKIPLMNLALNLSMSQTKLKFFTSTWTAPKWMKENGKYAGGHLKKEHYQTWANYFVRFLEEYKKQGLEFWAISTGNEPLLAKLPFIKIPSVNWDSKTASIWIRDHLGPTLRSSRFSDIKLLAIDDQRLFFKDYVANVMKNETTRSYVDGFSVHWYLDTDISPKVLENTHQRFPEKFILSTEASSGFLPWQTHVDLGAWDRAEKYANDILENLNNWVTGWVDWNLALDTKGGPTYINNHIDAAIIVNATAGEFYKQPMYYAISHFSKFIPEGSVRIDAKSDVNLPLVALTRPGPDKKVVLVVLNKNNEDVPVTIKDELRHINLNLERRSITTVIY